MGKASVVLRQILLFQILVRGFVAVDLLPPKLLNQTILMYAVDPLHSSLGLRRTSSNDPDPQLLTHAPKLRDWDLSPQPLGGRSFSFVHVLPVGIERAGHAYFRIQARNTPAAAQIVSSFPIPASVSLVASSTLSIRQPRGPRASNQSWKLPSNCTSSPKCHLRSLRWQCFLRFRCRLHRCSANIQRRKVS